MVDGFALIAPMLLVFGCVLAGLIGWLLRALVHDLIDRRRGDAVQRTVREFEQTIAEAAQALRDSRGYISGLEAVLRGMQGEVFRSSEVLKRIDDRFQAYTEAGRTHLTRKSDQVDPGRD